MQEGPSSRREVALDFVRRFCAGDVEGLATLLEPDLRFRGPLFEFDTSAAYLASLRADPPERSAFEVHSVTESPGDVALFYDYRKPGGTVTVAQLFEFADPGSAGPTGPPGPPRIRAIRLVFDASPLRRRS